MSPLNLYFDGWQQPRRQVFLPIETRKKGIDLVRGGKGCQMLNLQTKNLSLGKLEWNIWYISRPFWYTLWSLGILSGHFGILCGHLVFCTAILVYILCSHLVRSSPFGMLHREKSGSPGSLQKKAPNESRVQTGCRRSA
jgi:hypothetical protein